MFEQQEEERMRQYIRSQVVYKKGREEEAEAHISELSGDELKDLYAELCKLERKGY